MKGAKIGRLALPELKPIAEVGLKSTLETTKDAAIEKKELWNSLQQNTVDSAAGFAVNKIGSDFIFRRGPGATPVIGGHWTGPVGISILGGLGINITWNATESIWKSEDDNNPPKR
jgi:hypothetical protein